jgi:tRNA(Ile)-lysidine synthase
LSAEEGPIEQVSQRKERFVHMGTGITNVEGETIYGKVRAFMETHSLGEDEAILVAVSGGVDSMVLLHLLNRYVQETRKNLYAIHVHHGLRTASDAELMQVQRICDDWGIPLHIRHLRMMTAPDAEGSGIEARARELRYAAFAEVAERLQVRQVALGHHANDQAETMVWRMIRGTSLRGLGGIRPVTKRDELVWLRPLLPFEKSTLYAYARLHDVPYAEDETNQDPTWTRNYIRHEVIPKLTAAQPRAIQHMVQLAALLQEDNDWMEAEARAWIAQNSTCDRSVYHLPLKPFEALPRPLQRRVITILLYCLASGEFSLSHIQSVLDLMFASSPSATVHLPQGVVAWRTYDELLMGVHPSVEHPDPLRDESGDEEYIELPVVWELSHGATLRVRGAGLDWEFTCRTWTSDDGMKACTNFQLILPGTVRELLIRTVRAGERIAPVGMAGRTKKLQDVFTDAKIHRSHRPGWPLFAVGETLVWIPGILRGESYLFSPQHPGGWVIEAKQNPFTGSRIQRRSNPYGSEAECL